MATVYEIITERIIEKLEAGVIPWRKTWDAPEPKNLISKKVYRGINYFLLNCLSDEYFLTYNQAKALGGEVRKGSKGIPVVFWQQTKYSKKETPDKEERGMMIRYYTVFAASDVDGIEDKIPASVTIERSATYDEFTANHKAQLIINNWEDKPDMQFEGKRACYIPSLDIIKLPEEKRFFSTTEYYSTAFHELIHSTGHASRLARKEVMEPSRFASHDYAQEELVAELGSVFLCHLSEINSTLDNSAAYINGWLKALRAEPKMLIKAAGKAQHAADMIIGHIMEEA